MTNIIDVEEAWSNGLVEFQDWQAEFLLEWNKPLLDMLVNIDLAVNADIYGGNNATRSTNQIHAEDDEPY